MMRDKRAKYYVWTVEKPEDFPVGTGGFHWGCNTHFGLVMHGRCEVDTEYRLIILHKSKPDVDNIWATHDNYYGCKCVTGTALKLSKQLKSYIDGSIYSDIKVLFKHLTQNLRVSDPDAYVLIEEAYLQYVDGHEIERIFID